MSIQMKKNDPVVMKIADIVFAMYCDQPEESLHLQEAYRTFLTSEEPEVTIRSHNNGLPQISLQEEEKIFDSEMVWSLYQKNGKNIFLFKSPISAPLPFRIAIFDGDFRHGEVHSHLQKCEKPSDKAIPSLLEFPLSEVLMMCLLAQGRGLMVNACGIEDHGKGYLFTRNFTHSKSTMARLWRDRATILDDNRIVLRRNNGRFWMYGTPWHGNKSVVSSQGVPLEKLFFLRLAKENNTHRKDGLVAPSILLTRCFPPFWDAKGMLFSLDFCAQVTTLVPCYELDFVPDGNIVDFIHCVE